MVRILINSVDELKKLQQKFQSLKVTYFMLQEGAVREVSQETLEEIKTKMSQNNFSDKIIDSTFVGKIERFGNLFRSHFISNYESDSGFDVSNAREEGTTQTKPIVPKKEGGTLRWSGNANQTMFRKKSRPKGMERLLIIENTIKENQDSANARVAEKMAAMSQKILGV